MANQFDIEEFVESPVYQNYRKRMRDAEERLQRTRNMIALAEKRLRCEFILYAVIPIAISLSSIAISLIAICRSL